MSARTYDPFAIEKPILKLGEHGEWVLADVTKANAEAIDALIQEFHDVAADPETDVDRCADIVGRLIEAACEDAKGATEVLAGLVNADENPIGVIALRGIVGFILEWIYGELSAGEG